MRQRPCTAAAAATLLALLFVVAVGCGGSGDEDAKASGLRGVATLAIGGQPVREATIRAHRIVCAPTGVPPCRTETEPVA